MTIGTDIPNLRLIELTPEDADAYYDLVDGNRGHLTRHGDYLDLGEVTPGSVAAELSNPDEHNARFGIWLDGQLVGRADLNPCTPGTFVLGHWLGGDFIGKGYAKAACEALIAYGSAELNATAIYADVTKGNAKSEALLAWLGFRAVTVRGSYTRFRLPLTWGPGFIGIRLLPPSPLHVFLFSTSASRHAVVTTSSVMGDRRIPS